MISSVITECEQRITVAGSVHTTILCLLALLVVGGCATEPIPQPAEYLFEEVASKRGVLFNHKSGATGDMLLPEIMGGGVAIADLNGDSYLDIYFVQSGEHNSQLKSPNELYFNDGTGRFTRGNAGFDDVGYGMGIATGDYDNDGDIDLFITNVGQNRLLNNDGSGKFVDATTSALFVDDQFSTAALFADFDADNDLDLFVVNYVDWRQSIERKCYDYSTGTRNYCDPAVYDRPSNDSLYRNNGDGTFTNVSSQLGNGLSRGNGLGAVASDFNGDGKVDVYVANDKTPNHLWINKGGLEFIEQGFELGAAMDDHGIAKAGMGVIAHDLDDDLDSDVIVVNIQGETDSVYRNESTYFADASAQFGLTRYSRNYTRFGIALADFNSDGYLDLYEGNGKVSISPEPWTSDPFAEPNVLFEGRSDKRFEYVPGSSIHDRELVHTSRSVAKGDINNDGLIDLVVVNRDAPSYLLLNRTREPGYWITLEVLEKYGSPVHNARVVVHTNQGLRLGEVQVAGSYLTANSPHVHFTFESKPAVQKLVVHWLDGIREDFTISEDELNQRITLRRGDGSYQN